MKSAEQKTVRFDAPDMRAVEKAAKFEGLDPGPYIRRCTLMYTHENHPEVFESDSGKK